MQSNPGRFALCECLHVCLYGVGELKPCLNLVSVFLQEVEAEFVLEISKEVDVVPGMVVEIGDGMRMWEGVF